jgi:hypothetical protein
MAELERITVNLIPRASKALDDLMRLNGYSKTDNVNRALTVYAFIERIFNEEGELVIRDKDGIESRLTIL